MKALTPALLLLLELCQHIDPPIAEAAAECTARLAALHPTEAAGLLLCDDGISNLCKSSPAFPRDIGRLEMTSVAGNSIGGCMIMLSM